MDPIANLFSSALTLYLEPANKGFPIKVDFVATTTPTNSLNAQGTEPTAYPFGTLVYKPSEKTGFLENWSPASFTPDTNNAGPELTVLHGGSHRENTLQFMNMILTPTPLPSNPAGIINGDTTTQVVYGVAGSRFVTVSFCYLRAENAGQ